MKGVWNKVIRVNLTNEEINIESYEEKLWRQYLGGSGLGAKLLYDEVDGNVEPLSPENKIYFLTGPFCGSSIPTSGRHAAVTKSPLTGAFAESDVGGCWGYELKNAGYDGIILEGRAEKISGQKMAETILTGNYRCKTCIIGCGRVIKIQEGPYKGVEGSGPEYEALGTLGGLCLIDNLEAIAYGNELCNKYGIDVISTGTSIGFAMELYEKGIITKEDTGGLEIKFGDEKVMIELIKLIGERKGFGEVLGEGVRIAAERIGGLAKEYAFHVKGLEFPAHDPRAFNGLALSYTTSNRGACHLAGFTHGYEKANKIPELGYDKPHDRHTAEGKAEFVIKMQNLMGVVDSLKVCKFAVSNGLKISTLVDWVKFVVGWEDYSFEELIKTGERIYNIKRLFNVKCGISRKDDTLPMRFLTLKREGEGVQVNLPPLGKMLSEYYEIRGWNEVGIPTDSKLKELDIL